jgi:HMG box factor
MRFLGPLVALSIGVLAACSTGRNGGVTSGSGGAGSSSGSGGSGGIGGGGCDQPDNACACTCEGKMVTFDLGGISECFMQGKPCVDAGTASADGGDSGTDTGTGGAVPVYESCTLTILGCD